MACPHVFLTRFNLPTTKIESAIYSPNWLTDRFDLFRKFTVPSVMAQVPEERYWIIYLDPQSPEWLKSYMSELEDAGVARPNYGGKVGREFVLGHLRDLLGRDSGAVITSNLDNDDGLARGFVERLRAVPVDAPHCALYFSHGLIRAGHRVYRRTDQENAFCAVRSDLADLQTCWSEWHNRLASLMPVVTIDGPPAWLQVVHGANVSNRVRGRLINPEPYRADFPGLLDDVGSVRPAERAADLLLRQPYRGVRDSVRGRGAKLAVRIVGQGGLEEGKYRLRRRLGRA